VKTCPWCLGSGRIIVKGLYGILNSEMCPRCVGQGKLP
jgi:DnaJ-class molecular chaperone